MISLEKMLDKFVSVKNFEYDNKKFMTNVPNVAPMAYLNVIFGPAEENVQKETIDPLNLPSELRRFYYLYNGAHLLSGAINIYGFRQKNYQIDRQNWKSIPPFDLIKTNYELISNLCQSNKLIIGSYDPDVSRIVIEKSSGQVSCTVGNDLARIRTNWSSFEDWISSEIKRLTNYFDQYGNRLVDIEDMLPGRSI